MFFFLAGSRDYKDRLGYVATTCPECGMRGLFTVEQERKKFTLYLVPTFEYSKKQYMSCPYCLEDFEVAEETRAIRNGKLDKLLARPKPRRKKT